MARKAFFSIDALMSLIPLLIMLTFVLQTYAYITNQITESTRSQYLFDKLVSIADYTVKFGAVHKVAAANENRINWIDEAKLSPPYKDSLARKTNLSQLYISTSPPADAFDICIYRLVVVGTDKKITRLFVCGV